MSRRQLKSAARLSDTQLARAENFRSLLINYSPYHGDEQETWAKIINGMSALELTNLSRQYRVVLETWYDSSAMVSMLSQDIVKRIQHIGRVDLQHARTALFGAAKVPTTSAKRLDQLIRAEEAYKIRRSQGGTLTRPEKAMVLRDITDVDILERTGYAPVTRRSKKRGFRKQNRHKWFSDPKQFKEGSNI